MRQPEPVAGLACGDHRLGRAAGALRVRPVRVEPETKRHADGVRSRAEQRHRAVDAAAHRHRRPSGARLGAEDRSERRRERVDRERLAADGGRLEQRQSGQRALEPVGVRVDDRLAVDDEADRRPLAVPRRVSEASRSSLHGNEDGARPCGPAPDSTLPIFSELCEPGEPGGCRAFRRPRRGGLGRDTCSLYVGVGSTLRPGATHRVERPHCTRSAYYCAKRQWIVCTPWRPSCRARARREVEVVPGRGRAAVDHLRRHLLAVELDARSSRRTAVADARLRRCRVRSSRRRRSSSWPSTGRTGRRAPCTRSRSCVDEPE